MPKLGSFTMICMSLLLVFVYGCNKGSNETKPAETNTLKQEQVEQAGETEKEEHEGERSGEHAEEGERGEHSGEGKGEHEGESVESGEGEETGPRIAKDGTYDEVRKGVRLILSFDDGSSSFVGIVENVTEKPVSRVRVEVHLSNGTELGPTELIDLEPGKKATIRLSAKEQSFEWWKAHAEAGVSEH